LSTVPMSVKAAEAFATAAFTGPFEILASVDNFSMPGLALTVAVAWPGLPAAIVDTDTGTGLAAVLGGITSPTC